MRDEIKERIGMIQKGEVPEGYKKTKVGIIPKEWNIKDFANLCSNKSGKYNANSDKKFVKCIELENIVPNQGMINGYFNGAELESTKNVFEKDNVLYGKLRPYLRKYYHTQCNGVCSSEIWVLKPKKTISSYYLYFLVQSDKFNQFTNLSCCGSKMPRADWEYVEQTLYPLPLPKEQEEIIKCLTNYEREVEKLDALIKEKKKKKKWILQKCFLEKENHFKEWKRVRLKDVLTEVKEKKQKQDIQIYSVAVQKGIVNQEEHLGRSYAAEDTSNYNVVSLGDIVYTKSPTGEFPYGIVKISLQNKKVAVSPLYGVFRPINNEIGYIIYSFFQDKNNALNYLNPIVQKGAKNTINITNDTFLTRNILLPVDTKIQKKIAGLFFMVDKEIELLEKKLEQIKLEKKAMMQLLLTGIIRVNQKGGE